MIDKWNEECLTVIKADRYRKWQDQYFFDMIVLLGCKLEVFFLHFGEERLSLALGLSLWGDSHEILTVVYLRVIDVGHLGLETFDKSLDQAFHQSSLIASHQVGVSFLE